jgi:predicted ribosome quality control (RQC) complex YloA/Tae2 family protein
VDCLRKVDADMSQERQLLPGMFYRLPPTQGKENPLSVLERSPVFPETWGQKIEKLLVDTFAGISPLIARELAFEAAGSTEALLSQETLPRLQERLVGLMTKVESGELAPYLLVRDGTPADFSFRAILQYGPGTESRRMESFSKLLDGFYAQREGAERIRQKGQDLIRSLGTDRDRLSRKLIIQEKELAGTKDRERLRQMGDLLTANFYRMERGIIQLETENYYDPEGGQISIKLDPLKTPQQNAARYYKDYNRAKTAERILTEQLATGYRELEYLNSVLESVSRAEGERDLEEIRQELVETGYIRRRGKARDRVKRAASKPLEFRSSSGLRISVGRNNSQNDALTTKLAGRGDLWFHAQKIHGAHVILWTEGGSPDLQSMTEAAMLAAWFSQGRSSGNVPVDYTPVRYVKKPAGARPGMVVYTTYETAYVTPEETIVKTLSV